MMNFGNTRNFVTCYGHCDNLSSLIFVHINTFTSRLPDGPNHVLLHSRPCKLNFQTTISIPASTPTPTPTPMSGPTTRRLAQNILDGSDAALNRSINTNTIQDLDIVASNVLSVFDHARPIGISPGYSAAGKLISLAIADDKNCCIIEFSQPKSKRTNGKPSSTPKPETPPPTHKPGVFSGRQKLQDHILCRSAGDIFAFDMGPLTMSLYCDLGGLRITNAVDIQSAFSAVDRKPLTGIQTILGDSVKINAENVTNVFFNPIYNNEDRNCITDLAQRAWVSQYLVGSGNGAEMFDKVKRIDTKKLDSSVGLLVSVIIISYSTSHTLASGHNRQGCQ